MSKSIIKFTKCASLNCLLVVLLLETIMMASLDNLVKDQVVPDVIDKKPGAEVTIVYPSGAIVQQGNKLTPTQVKDMPIYNYMAKPDEYYTLFMVDPDAPSREKPTMRELLHFMVVNIPGSLVARGEIKAEYIGAAPPKDTGFHRYVILVYKQDGKLCSLSNLKTISRYTMDGRSNFSARKFAKEYNLGEPIAANFFKAKYDDYVPILTAQLNQG